ncbi:hypothetical protein [Anatilimnocola floriformis]|uniref:hypothetical protein n=1 Tax=Anatilimnocola floriformis TaxID=2948575 RepID=UPI0020C256CD|nr:hypothetical protein [Anatilimnocola floriformis]
MLRSSFVLLALLILTGCGSKSNSVSGKVTFQGQPVTGGSITLLPQAGEGKPAAADLHSNGSFSMTPGSAAGGVTAGQNRVIYSAPVLEVPAGVELQPGQGAPLSPFAGLRPKNETVDITAGKNSLEIELTK